MSYKQVYVYVFLIAKKLQKIIIKRLKNNQKVFLFSLNEVLELTAIVITDDF